MKALEYNQTCLQHAIALYVCDIVSLPAMHKWMLFTFLTSACSLVNSQILKKPIPDKTVVLTFDDAVKSHYTNVAPLLKQYGFNATFFVCEFPPDFSDTTKYMSWQKISQLSKMGFEIGNHTKDHVAVNTGTEKQLNEQLSYVEDKCISLQIPKPVTFAYPGYVTDPPALSTLEERGYLFARIGGSRAYDPQSDHPFLVPGYTALDTNRAEILHAFTKAVNGKIVVITFHGIPDEAHPWVTTPLHLFKEYLAYLHANGYTCIAMKDLQQFVNVPKALDIKPEFPSPPMRKRTIVLIAAFAMSLAFVVAMTYKKRHRTKAKE